MQELTLLKRNIVTALNERLPRPLVDDLHLAPTAARPSRRLRRAAFMRPARRHLPSRTSMRCRKTCARASPGSSRPGEDAPARHDPPHFAPLDADHEDPMSAANDSTVTIADLPFTTSTGVPRRPSLLCPRHHADRTAGTRWHLRSRTRPALDQRPRRHDLGIRRDYRLGTQSEDVRRFSRRPVPRPRSWSRLDGRPVARALAARRPTSCGFRRLDIAPEVQRGGREHPELRRGDRRADTFEDS
jgi:hypothetical protein